MTLDIAGLSNDMQWSLSGHLPKESLQKLELYKELTQRMKNIHVTLIDNSGCP